jgi:peroxiredoxin
MPDSDTLLDIGDPCPPIEDTATDNTTVTNGTFDGHYVLLLLFMRSCNFCHKALAFINRFIVPKYSRNNLLVYGVGRDHPVEELQDFVDLKKIGFPLIQDPDRIIYSHFADKTVPRVFILDPKGRVVYSNKGYDRIEYEKMEEFLESKLT